MGKIATSENVESQRNIKSHTDAKGRVYILMRQVVLVTRVRVTARAQSGAMTQRKEIRWVILRAPSQVSASQDVVATCRTMWGAMGTWDNLCAASVSAEVGHG